MSIAPYSDLVSTTLAVSMAQRVKMRRNTELRCRKSMRTAIANELSSLSIVDYGTPDEYEKVSLFGIPVIIDQSIPAGIIRLVGEKGIIQEWRA